MSLATISRSSDPLFSQLQLSEARFLIRFASGALTEKERSALSEFVNDNSAEEAAQRRGNITRGGIWMAQKSGLRKMRKRLTSIGIHSVREIL